jgi:hypothetical protein
VHNVGAIPTDAVHKIKHKNSFAKESNKALLSPIDQISQKIPRLLAARTYAWNACLSTLLGSQSCVHVCSLGITEERAGRKGVATLARKHAPAADVAGRELLPAGRMCACAYLTSVHACKSKYNKVQSADYKDLNTIFMLSWMREKR